jgi:hypothetical protein
MAFLFACIANSIPSRKIEQLDKSKVIFNVNHRAQSESESIAKRQALKQKVLADAEAEADEEAAPQQPTK